MSDTPSATRRSRTGRLVEGLGTAGAAQVSGLLDTVADLGAMAALLGRTLQWTGRGLFQRSVKLGRAALAEQMVRVGVKSIAIVVMVQMFIGCILALQLAPTLQQYGQLQRVADVVAIAVVRELGPLITAIVLSGFAGASIAAEIGAMVESEEIKALRAHAVNPIRFLIVPRFLATVIMIVGLAIIADVVGVLGGLLTAWGVLQIPPEIFLDYAQNALVVKDLITGLVKAGVFGVLISMIACHAGMNVRGGAVGVGSATTATVVKSIVAIIGMDAVFTAVFYALGL